MAYLKKSHTETLGQLKQPAHPVKYFSQFWDKNIKNCPPSVLLLFTPCFQHNTHAFFPIRNSHHNPHWLYVSINIISSYSFTHSTIKGVLHPCALFLKTFCIFSKNKATLDKISYRSGQKCSKELKNHSFTSVEAIVLKLQWKMCENQYFTCFEP